MPGSIGPGCNYKKLVSFKNLTNLITLFNSLEDLVNVDLFAVSSGNLPVFPSTFSYLAKKNVAPRGVMVTRAVLCHFNLVEAVMTGFEFSTHSDCVARQ